MNNELTTFICDNKDELIEELKIEFIKPLEILKHIKGFKRIVYIQDLSLKMKYYIIDKVVLNQEERLLLTDNIALISLIEGVVND